MLDSRNHSLIIVVAVALLIPLVITLAYPQLNQQAFLSINQQGGLLPDALWSNLTLLGDGLWAMGFMSLVVFIAYRGYGGNVPNIDGARLLANAAIDAESAQSKNHNNIRNIDGARLLANASIYGGLLLGILVQALKKYFDVDRPSRFFSDVDFNVIGEPLSFHSFPSGHSTTIFYMVTIIIAYFGIRSVPQILLAMGLLFAASMIALSRVTTGVHFPADILAGSLLGWLFGWACIALLQNKLHPLASFIAVALIGLASILLLLHDSKLPQVAILTISSGIIFILFSAINLWNLRPNKLVK